MQPIEGEIITSSGDAGPRFFFNYKKFKLFIINCYVD